VPNPTQRAPWIVWPFYAIGWLLTSVVSAAGRLICGILGLVLMVLGTLLSLTIVGAVVGVPLVLLGFLFVIRALF